MKIYTRTGDSGTTGILGGDRVTKFHPRIESYGSVDELNAAIGVVLSDASLETLGAAIPVLTRIQSELFVVGADLATPSEARTEVPRVTDEMITRLERDIDDLDASLDPIRSFVLPGGSAAAARLHVARTVCRRSERRVTRLADTEEINKRTMIYLNRLADLLFVMARYANHRSGVGDIAWSGS